MNFILLCCNAFAYVEIHCVHSHDSVLRPRCFPLAYNQTDESCVPCSSNDSCVRYFLMCEAGRCVPTIPMAQYVSSSWMILMLLLFLLCISSEIHKFPLEYTSLACFLFVGYPLCNAVSLMLCLLLGRASYVLINLWRINRQCLQDTKPILSWDVALLFLPSLLSSTALGWYLSHVLPHGIHYSFVALASLIVSWNHLKSDSRQSISDYNATTCHYSVYTNYSLEDGISNSRNSNQTTDTQASDAELRTHCNNELSHTIRFSPTAARAPSTCISHRKHFYNNSSAEGENRGFLLDEGIHQEIPCCEKHDTRSQIPCIWVTMGVYGVICSGFFFLTLYLSRKAHLVTCGSSKYWSLTYLGWNTLTVISFLLGMWYYRTRPANSGLVWNRSACFYYPTLASCVGTNVICLGVDPGRIVDPLLSAMGFMFAPKGTVTLCTITILSLNLCFFIFNDGASPTLAISIVLIGFCGTWLHRKLPPTAFVESIQLTVTRKLGYISVIASCLWISLMGISFAIEEWRKNFLFQLLPLCGP